MFIKLQNLVKLHFIHGFRSFLTENTGFFYYKADLLLPYMARFVAYVNNHTEHKESLSGKIVFIMKKLEIKMTTGLSSVSGQCAH